MGDSLPFRHLKKGNQMPALNFNKELAPAVESGEKGQTIRKVRKRPIKKGDTLYLFDDIFTDTGYRLLRKMVCLGVTPILIYEKDIRFPLLRTARFSIDKMAKKDGFNGVEAFLDFFRKQYGLPFEGVLIWWE